MNGIGLDWALRTRRRCTGDRKRASAKGGGRGGGRPWAVIEGLPSPQD